MLKMSSIQKNCSFTNPLHCTKFGSMRLGAILGRRIYLSSVIIIRISSRLNVKRRGRVLGRPLVSLPWSIMMLLIVLPSLRVKVLLLLITVNTQNQMENLETTMTLMNLFMFLDLLRPQTS